MARLLGVLASLLVLFGPATPAWALDAREVPEALKPWIDWVLADENSYQCPFFHPDFQQKRCSWPGPLQLELHRDNGRFSGTWTLYRPDWIILPGDARHWPQQVSINRQPATVIEHDGKPSIYMPAGDYRVDGALFWDSLPENLAIADDSGLIRLSIDGQAVLYPRIEQGALWLHPGQTATTSEQQNSLDLQVFRQIIDDIPLQVVTRLDLQVSGAAREITLPQALLPAFIPVSLDSPLPARLEADGSLRVQIRPGRWPVTITARHPQTLPQLSLPTNTSDWPQAEVWVFQAMPALRLVEIGNLPSIDGSLTNLPEEWRHLPAYRIKAGESMAFKTIRRGDPEPEPNQLRLQRTLWLDFDGGGYTASDRIDGSMTREWRLNALGQTRLGQVLINGQNQLITQLPDQQQGVEIRRGALQLQADSRIHGDIDALNAVGWRQSFQQVRAKLNIPPGWRLLAVSGVDNRPNSWLSHWTLLDLFLVLIAALAIARLWSWQWGALALLTLTLIWQEADAPRWIWLNLLAALALLQILPDNRFALWVKGYRNLCRLGLLLIVIPFMIAQLRIGMYPQLEQPWQPIQPPLPASLPAPVPSDEEGMAQPMQAMEMADAIAPRANRIMRKAYAPPAGYAGSASSFDRIDPDANLQTGPGLPQWQWQAVELSWNGTVDEKQSIHLWYLPPSLALLLHVIQALLAALLSLKMLGSWHGGLRFSAPPLCLCLLPLLLLPNSDVYADIPDYQLREQLKTRLLKAPPCLPSCAGIATMTVRAQPDTLAIELQIHAQQDVAVPLPAQLEQWLPEHVTVDGHEAQALSRQDDGWLWLVIATGVHQVSLQGRYGAHDKFTLALPLPPQRTLLTASGWRVDGLYENGKTAPQLEFSRLDIGADKQGKALQQAALPAFVRVEKTLHLGLDWRMTTRVESLVDGDAAVVVELPLLAGEAVTTPDVRVKEGKVLVNMPAGQGGMEWQSLLEKREQLELRATDTAQWSEIWRAEISPIWHVQASGLAAVHRQGQQDAWRPEWRPWPGETLLLTVTRPQAVAGATLTIDKSELRIKPGQRTTEAELALSLRSSKGGQHNLRLPAGAQLQNVVIDGASQPIRQQGEMVTLPIHPGAQQVALSWQTGQGLAMITTTPVVDLGSASVNSHIRMTVGEDRWVLFTLGPKFGPAALIWGLLIVLLLLALGLGKIGLTPLKSWQWFLLSIGLSQIHLAAGMLVVVWLMTLGFRADHSPASRRLFNLAQIGLGLLTLLALVLLFAAVQQGLLGSPDMQIAGNQSTAFNLNWYQNSSGAQLPTATVVSLPMPVYRLLMLSWALWMALSLLDWLRWGWGCFARGGIWKSKPVVLPH